MVQTARRVLAPSNEALIHSGLTAMASVVSWYNGQLRPPRPGFGR